MLQVADARATVVKVAPEAVLQVAQAIVGEVARVVLASAHLASLVRSFSLNEL